MIPLDAILSLEPTDERPPRILDPEATPDSAPSPDEEALAFGDPAEPGTDFDRPDESLARGDNEDRLAVDPEDPRIWGRKRLSGAKSPRATSWPKTLSIRSTGAGGGRWA